MIRKIFPLLAALLLSSSSPTAIAQTNTVIGDLNDLITRVNEKISSGRATPEDLTENLKEFDDLFARHRNAPDNERAQILIMKGQLYLQVLHDPETALDCFKQVKKDFPQVPLNVNADEVIRMLQKAVDARRIQRTLVVGAEPPDFRETDLTGAALSLSQYRGKVVLLDFWATWCVPCMMELPNVLKLYEKFHGKGFEVIGVSLDQDRQQLDKVIKTRGISWPQYNDGNFWDTKLVLQYGVQSLPGTFLIGRNGRIAGVNLRGAQLEEAVAFELLPGWRRSLISGSQAVNRFVHEHAAESLLIVFTTGIILGRLSRRRAPKSAPAASA